MNMYNYMRQQNIYPINNASQIDSSILTNYIKVIYIDAGADFSYPNNNIYHFLLSKYSHIQKYEYPEIFKVYEFSIK